jgi:AraC family transcriptional regulator, regulatory protein of adaptative response / methylated-DNA-[protein]-cysteine methyltransferase
MRFPENRKVPTTDIELVQHACRIIEAATDTPLKLDDLSRELAVSPFHLHRLFKSITGLTPHQYAEGHRINKFKNQVKEGNDLTTALYNAGYGSVSRLYEVAAGHLGMSPASYRRGGQGKEIHYTIIDTWLGRMLVAATQQGICAVSFGDKDQQLFSFLQNEYPAATLKSDDQALNQWLTPLLEHLDGHRPHLALPLDLQSTAFKLRVWEELRLIPYGETRTYSEIANAIGRPKAVRAVANACATNPTAVVTPCHRVVRRDGSLAGYRWGIERKKALLDQENKNK